MATITLTLHPHELAAIRQIPISQVFQELRTGVLPYDFDAKGDLTIPISYTYTLDVPQTTSNH